MKLLMIEDSVQLLKSEATLIILVVLFIWNMGYITEAEVTRMWEKTTIMHDCIFTPAPEDSSRA